MPTTWTPLRYPGGKSRLAPYLKSLLSYNNLSNCSYVEPFAGGAGAAINLLRSGSVNTLHLNDIDIRLYAFWYSVLNYSEDLCQLIANTPLTVDEWYRQREILDHSLKYSVIDVGFAILYMNRTNRSGIIEGGIIGGKNQTGAWKINARFNRATLIRKIKDLSSYRKHISLYCMDARDFLPYVVDRLSRPTFIYLDPPFYTQGKHLYENHYTHNDHVKLSDTLRDINTIPWIISYDNVEPIRKIYQDYTHVDFGISYSAGRNHIGNEIIFFGPSIRALDSNEILMMRRPQPT
jgi:DNA adenine methylase